MNNFITRIFFVASFTLSLLAVLYGEEAFKEPDFTVSDDFGMSSPMVTKLPDEKLLKNLREDDYAKMTLDDPLLRAAYVEVFWKAMSIPSDEGLRPELAAALNDMKRRGNDVTPVLLQLMKENPYSPFEFAALGAAYIDGMDSSPYIEYAREALKTRWKDLKSTDVDCIASLLLYKGVPSDVDFLRETAHKRPYLSDVVKVRITRFQRSRASHAQGTGPADSDESDEKRHVRGTPKASPPPIENAATQNLLVWLPVAIVAAIGASWLLFRKLKP